MLDPDSVLIYLRNAGITVHMVRPGVGGVLVCYLESTLGQADEARTLLNRIGKGSDIVTQGIVTVSRTER